MRIAATVSQPRPLLAGPRDHAGAQAAGIRVPVPLQRIPSLDDARRALWIEPHDPTLSARIRSLWQFSARLVELMIPRGVRRFRRIEDANAERERWVADRVNALVAERQVKPPPRREP